MDDEPAEVRIVGVAPKVVSPAWELELIIAGAVTFALFQLPGAIDEARATLEPQVTGVGEMALFFATFYAKGTVFALLTTFLLNLVARAYWVGLVGLQSVYPAGPRWDEYKAGPFLKALYRRRLRPLPQLIARVDDFASVLFSFGFLIGTLVVMSCLFAVAIGVTAWVITRVVPGAPRLEQVAKLLFWGFFTPAIGIPLLDKYVGSRLRPGGAAARALAAGVRTMYTLSGSGVFGPVFVTLFTNIRRRTFYPVFYGAFVGTMLLAGADYFRTMGALDGGIAVFAPEDADRRGLNAAHYESMRRPGDRGDAVTIQADVIADPYARLFIPYEAERLNAAVPVRCPGVRAQRPEGFHLVRRRPPADTATAERDAEGVLSCLAGIYRVALDGRPVDALRFRFTTHPTTGRAGVVAYLPLAGLAPGEHRLTVHSPPPAPGTRGRVKPSLDIPFWR